MQTLAETPYQDLYRIRDGVLLVVNKFDYIDYSDITKRNVTSRTGRGYTKTYHDGCQNQLTELKSDYIDGYSGVTIPKGTVLYWEKPVELTDDKDRWDIQIKTTGESFSGNMTEFIEIMNEIREKVDSYK